MRLLSVGKWQKVVDYQMMKLLCFSMDAIFGISLPRFFWDFLIPTHVYIKFLNNINLRMHVK